MRPTERTTGDSTNRLTATVFREIARLIGLAGVGCERRSGHGAVADSGLGKEPAFTVYLRTACT